MSPERKSPASEQVKVNHSHYSPKAPKSSRKLRYSDYMTMAQDGGKIVSLYTPAAFTPRKYSWYSSLLEAESIPGP